MVNGLMLKNAIISGANNISKSKQMVNELNIFPVPDGDTGTNMSMTINAGAKELLVMENDVTASEVASKTASALLRGARGNSGVILSLLFRGFSKGLKDKDEATGADLAAALEIGVKEAYKAVMKPTEGTILTVGRVASERAKVAAEKDDDAVYVWSEICKGAKEALEQTPELLPVLKKAGVVDAGGKGLLLIFEGMKSVFETGVIIDGTDINADLEPEGAPQKNAAGEFEGEITFTYCTEFIVEKSGCDLEPSELRSYLETIGDCVVVVDDEEIIKVHVHTDNPGNALQQALKFGQLITVKIENMRKQFEEAKASVAPKKLEKVDATEEFSFVAVAAGDGLNSLFKDLGCTHVVSGGQTMNPSTEDILEAVEACPGKTVYVLPNNKNIIMAAEQAVPLSDREIIVVPTKTIPQGISAMLAFDQSDSVESNKQMMADVAETVDTGLVTFAARDSSFMGNNIKQNDIIALENGKLTFTEKTAEKAAIKLVKRLATKETAFITVIYGEGVKEEDANEVVTAISSKMGSQVEINLVNGGQPVYYYIVSVE